MVKNGILKNKFTKLQIIGHVDVPLNSTTQWGAHASIDGAPDHTSDTETTSQLTALNVLHGSN